jgi:hypothetical protein
MATCCKLETVSLVRTGLGDTTVSLESLPVTGIPDSLDCIIKDLLYVSDSDGGGAVRVDVRLDVNFGVVHVGGVSLLACCQGILLCR